MRRFNLAVALLASLLSPAILADPINDHGNIESLLDIDAATCKADQCGERNAGAFDDVLGSDKGLSVGDLGIEGSGLGGSGADTGAPVDVGAVVSGYRFSRFSSFYSIARYCAVTSSGPSSCVSVTDKPVSVPEPGTLLLLGSALLLLIGFRRHRNLTA